MSTMVGMNLTTMRELARSFQERSNDLNQCTLRVDRLSRNVDWLGRDAENFRSEWRTMRQQLLTAGQALVTLHDLLKAQVDEQERTSNEYAGGTGLPSPGAPLPGLPWDIPFPTAEELGRALEQWLFDGATGLQDFINSLGPDAYTFLEWLGGPKTLAPDDLTALVPGLQEGIGDAIDWLDTAPVGPLPAAQDWVRDVFGFQYVPDKDFYTTNENSLQSGLGYMDTYDLFHKTLGMDLDKQVIEFNADGKEYRLELWKGSYASGGAYGGEIGLYTRDPNVDGVEGLRQAMNPEYYSTAGEEDKIRMVQTVYDNNSDEELLTNDSEGGGEDRKHFWNLGSRTDVSREPESLGQRGTLYVEDPEVREAMFTALQHQEGITDVMIGGNGEISYDWKHGS